MPLPKQRLKCAYASSGSSKCCASMMLFWKVCGKRLFKAATVVRFCWRLIMINVMIAATVINTSAITTPPTVMKQKPVNGHAPSKRKTNSYMRFRVQQ